MSGACAASATHGGAKTRCRNPQDARILARTLFLLMVLRLTAIQSASQRSEARARRNALFARS